MKIIRSGITPCFSNIFTIRMLITSSGIHPVNEWKKKKNEQTMLPCVIKDGDLLNFGIVLAKTCAKKYTAV